MCMQYSTCLINRGYIEPFNTCLINRGYIEPLVVEGRFHCAGTAILVYSGNVNM